MVAALAEFGKGIAPKFWAEKKPVVEKTAQGWA